MVSPPIHNIIEQKIFSYTWISLVMKKNVGVSFHKLSDSSKQCRGLSKENVFKLADVEFAIMEPSGDINVLLTRENQPLTPKHLGIKVAPEQEPQMVIMDTVKSWTNRLLLSG